MALLQISEPGESPDPHQGQVRARAAIGIDLGTTHSLVGTVHNGFAEILLDEQGRALLPSIVHFRSDHTVAVGAQAQAALSSDPANVVASVKRMMGRGLSDVVHREAMPYDFIDAPGMVRLRTQAGEKTPVEISAEILKALRLRAEHSLNRPIEGAVITVPAYFDDAQRQATKDAARLAGLNVLRLLNEPTAAAIAYGLDQAAEGIYAIFDLGGGTFDISILKLSKGVFEVMATGGDSALGGDDFDHRLFCWLAEQAKLLPLSASDARTLMLKAREAKELLSSQPEVHVQQSLRSGELVDVTVTAQGFAQMTQALVGKTLAATRRALADASLSSTQVKGVVLVGGATRMPHVRKAVAELFGQPPLINLDPDKVVALGAAMQANLLMGNAGEDWLLLDVIPLSLGLETYGGLVEKLIPRNATIPVARAQEFTTFKNGQTAMNVHVVQGERELAQDCRSLARFDLTGLPPMAAGAARIRVQFQVDADGLLSVEAREATTGVHAEVTVKPAYGLSDEEVAQMLQQSFQSAQSDMKSRALVEQQVEADRLLEATNAALRADGDLLDVAQRSALDSAVNQLAVLRAGSQDHLELKQGVEQLSAATDVFAALRMDRAVRLALAGKRLDELAE